MKRRMHPMCVTCLVKKQQEAITPLGDAGTRLAYLKEVMEITAENCLTDSPSLILYKIQQQGSKYFPDIDYFEAEKQRFNAMLLPRQAEIYKHITASEDPLLTALLLSMTGNYIDNGTVENINEETLNSIMFNFDRLGCDCSAYGEVKRRLDNCNHLVVLHDNCGEVVLDKLLIRLLGTLYPNMHITSVVRGGYVLNDATMKDAEQIGLAEVSHVISSGYSIAGTELAYLSCEAQQAVQSADFIISKGQGNFETLCGCGLPIVYLFLCKCELQCYHFGCEPLRGVMKLEDGVSFFDQID